MTNAERKWFVQIESIDVQMISWAILPAVAVSLIIVVQQHMTACIVNKHEHMLKVRVFVGRTVFESLLFCVALFV